MAVIDVERDAVVVRIVYDGPPYAGKTTSIRSLARSLGRAPVTPLERADRTVFFDWLEYTGGLFEGHQIHCQIVSVPGQPELDGRRRALLQLADAVVFVVDSSTDERAQHSARYLRDVRELLARREGAPVGIVLQANKRDLPGALPRDALRALLGADVAAMALTESTAGEGSGVRETFVLAVRLAIDRIRAQMVDRPLEVGRPEVDSAEELLALLNRLEQRLGMSTFAAAGEEEGALAQGPAGALEVVVAEEVVESVELAEAALGRGPSATLVPWADGDAPVPRPASVAVAAAATQAEAEEQVLSVAAEPALAGAVSPELAELDELVEFAVSPQLAADLAGAAPSAAPAHPGASASTSAREVSGAELAAAPAPLTSAPPTAQVSPEASQGAPASVFTDDRSEPSTTSSEATLEATMMSSEPASKASPSGADVVAAASSQQLETSGQSSNEAQTWPLAVVRDAALPVNDERALPVSPGAVADGGLAAPSVAAPGLGEPAPSPGQRRGRPSTQQPPQAGLEPDSGPRSVRRRGLTNVLTPRAGLEPRDLPPSPPSVGVPSGTIWPPVEGRMILHEACSSALVTVRTAAGDWAAGQGAEWRIQSARHHEFSSFEDGRRELLSWARDHALLSLQLSPYRCVVLAETGRGTWRLWQIARESQSLRSWILEAAGEPLQSLYRRLVDAAALLGDALVRAKGSRLHPTLATFGRGRGRFGGHYVGLMPPPGEVEAGRGEGPEAEVAEQLGDLLVLGLSSRCSELVSHAAELWIGATPWDGVVSSAMANALRRLSA